MCLWVFLLLCWGKVGKRFVAIIPWPQNCLDFLFFRHLILLFAITLSFHFQNTVHLLILLSIPFISNSFSVFLFYPNTPYCRLNLSSSTSARTPALARTTALTLSPGPSWVTAPPTPIRSTAVSHSTTRWWQPTCLAPPPPPLFSQTLKRVMLTHSTHSARDFHHLSVNSQSFAPWVHCSHLSVQSGD